MFAKIKAIDAKHGKFDFVLCVGDFFGPLQETSTEKGAQGEVLQLINGAIAGVSFTVISVATN